MLLPCGCGVRWGGNRALRAQAAYVLLLVFVLWIQNNVVTVKNIKLLNAHEVHV